MIYVVKVRDLMKIQKFDLQGRRRETPSWIKDGEIWFLQNNASTVDLIKSKQLEEHTIFNITCINTFFVCPIFNELQGRKDERF